MESQRTQDKKTAEELVLQLMERIAKEPQNHFELASEIKNKFSVESFMQISLSLLGKSDYQLPENLRILMGVLMRQMINQVSAYDQEDNPSILQNIIEAVLLLPDLKSKRLFADNLLNILPKTSSADKIGLFVRLVIESNNILSRDSFDQTILNRIVSYLICLSRILKESVLKVDEDFLFEVENLFFVDSSKQFPFSGYLRCLSQLEVSEEGFLELYFDDFLPDLFKALQFSKTIGNRLNEKIDIWIDFFSVVVKVKNIKFSIFLKTFKIIDTINSVMSKLKNFKHIDLFLDKYGQFVYGFLFELLDKMDIAVLNKEEEINSTVLRVIILLLSNQKVKEMLEPKIPFIIKELILPSIKMNEMEKDNITDNPVEYVNYRFDCVDLKKSKTSKTNAFLLLDVICQKYPEFLYFFFKTQVYTILVYLNPSNENLSRLNELSFNKIDSSFFRFTEDQYDLVSTAFDIVTSLFFLINEIKDYFNLVMVLFKTVAETTKNVNILEDSSQSKLIKHLLSSTYLLYTFSCDCMEEEDNQVKEHYLSFAFTFLKNIKRSEVLSTQMIMTLQKIINEDEIQEFILRNFNDVISVLVEKLIDFNMTEIFEIIKVIAEIENDQCGLLLFENLVGFMNNSLKRSEEDFSKLLTICVVLLEAGKINELSENTFVFLNELIGYCSKNNNTLYLKEMLMFLSACFKNFEGMDTVYHCYMSNFEGITKAFSITFEEQSEILFSILKGNRNVYIKYIDRLNRFALRLSNNIYSFCSNERKMSLLVLIMILRMNVLSEENILKINSQFINFIQSDLKLNIEGIFVFDFINITGHLNFDNYIQLFKKEEFDLMEFIRKEIFLLLNKNESSLHSYSHLSFILLRAIDSSHITYIEKTQLLKLLTLILCYNQKRNYGDYIEEKDELNYQIYSMLNLYSIKLESEDDSNEYINDASIVSNAGSSCNGESEEGNEELNGKTKSLKNKDIINFYDKTTRLFFDPTNSEYTLFRNMIFSLKNNNNELLSSIYNSQYLPHIKHIQKTDYFTTEENISIRKIVRLKRN